MYESLANSLVLAAQSHITLANGAVAVNLQGLMPHLRTAGVLEHRGAAYDIFALEREHGTTAEAFEQLLIRGGNKYWAENATVRRKEQMACELLGRAQDGRCTAFLGTNGFWKHTLYNSIRRSQAAYAHAEIALPGVLPLDLPRRIDGCQALLGVQFAFLEGMETGFLGIKKRMTFGALRAQGHPIVSEEAEAMLPKLFEE